MTTPKLEYQDRDGLFSEHRQVSQGAHQSVRLTVPVREALAQAGAKISADPDSTPDEKLYVVELADTVPAGIVAARILNSYNLALRLAIEPAYPNEIDGYAYWEQVDFSPCPVCGAPLVWYEAGFVPGYRVCARPPHHHVLAR